MAGISDEVYMPNEEVSAIYDRMFTMYAHLYNTLVRDPKFMHDLHELRVEQM